MAQSHLGWFLWTVYGRGAQLLVAILGMLPQMMAEEEEDCHQTQSDGGGGW